MKKSIEKFESLVQDGILYLETISEENLSKKIVPEKWSKKEILGHLVDSAINNLQRFTEIQFSEKPFKIKPYKQNELVKVNFYHEAKTEELINLWKALNLQIIFLMKLQTEETLSFIIEFPSGEKNNLEFLMTDYIAHLEHHLQQIKNQND
ncbi:DinB family protein [Aureivirga marina]|uniref:DinB family protein n=1 Tax=Aureivirga marina TaxID=1182451 RepID=UPI0018CBBE95|nr:DinB family protein [Aureivirga marina]